MEKKKREGKLKNALQVNRDFLAKKLKEEWEGVEQFTRRDEFKRELKKKSKEAGVFMAKSVLVLLAVGGALTVAAIAPNILSAFGRNQRHRGYFEEGDFKKVLRRLKRGGHINSKQGVSGVLQLTPKGEQKVLNISFKNLKLRVSEDWDGYWRMVLFDIPLKNKWAREGFRDKLKLMGFYSLQKSVFISPYPCEQEVNFLCGIYNIHGNVRLIETQSVGEDKNIKEYFGLS